MEYKLMKGIIRSMRGEQIDMSSLSAKNSHAVALGNANMNARGDIIDRGGKILKSRETVVQEYYRNNPKAVTQSVSLRDLGDEVLTPKEMWEKIEGAEPEEKPVVRKRKIIEDKD